MNNMRVKCIDFNIKITGTYKYHSTLNSQDVCKINHMNLKGRECSYIRYFRFGSLCVNCKYFYSFEPNCVSELFKGLNKFRHYTKIIFILLDISKCVVKKKRRTLYFCL